MEKTSEEINRKLKILLATTSYPVLANLNYFRDYNNYINESLKREITLLDDSRPDNKGELFKLTMKELSYYGEVRKYKSFSNIMRVSLLTSLCAFIENVITSPCDSYNNENQFDKYKRKMGRRSRKLSTIQVAKRFLIENGFTELDKIPNWKYIFDMMTIRNRFVHSDGSSTAYIDKISSTYAFSISQGKITLGDDFIGDFIGVLEKFSIAYAELIYPNENKLTKIFRDKGFDVEKFTSAVNRYIIGRN
ncbi:hypothetical protein [Paenibacillus soyae]|uniref:Uncharacterized protein n=1 Tax=Paenibacillus soyae TaxID=2969249 RepID=A0A9X2S9D3_9BACL|nr:hypothetical protein [Paenibacillus soyae]MCR2805339.1 hypothetical protein [Paenibacillus soyae]